MILTSTTATIDFKAPWREDDPEAPVFTLRAGSVIERAQMEAEIAGPHRAGLVYGYELLAAARSGIATLLADEPEYLEQVQALLNAEVESGADSLSDEDKQVMREVRKILAEHWPEYRDLDAQIERRRNIAPIVALKRFCTKIEGPGITFSAGRDGVSDTTLGQLAPMEMMIAGNRAFALQYGATADAEKNSEQPPASGDGPTSSNSDDTSKAAGK